MNKFKYYFILIIACLSLFSCSKDDNSIETEPLRDFGEQFEKDKETIEEYLDTYTFVHTNAPGETRDQDVVFSKITDPVNQRSIMSYLNSDTFPKLIKKTVELHEITYELYYLVLREGTGDSPCNVDEVLASYKGDYLYYTVAKPAVPATATDPEIPAVPSELLASQFEKLTYPEDFFDLSNVVVGWSEVFPEFKTGDNPTEAGDGTLRYNNFGAGVMFLPSGLAYYNRGQGSIPSYSPLVFSFKLYAIKRSDSDNDGIPSYLEDLNGDGYLRAVATTNNPLEDSDEDGIPNYLDIDDDGDGYVTKFEITKPAGINSGLSKYFPFDPVEDNPFTVINETETKGIPAFAATGEPDYTSPGRLRLHLDKDHHTAKP
ncbi:MAG: hypothetical protein B7Y83_12135 [Flavobacteriales bacterium 32-34-25]|nr:MAG: hypothetical protein B7Y83_12135 [Flavobacteriales bacterium 32-34-25]